MMALRKLKFEPLSRSKLDTNGTHRKSKSKLKPLQNYKSENNFYTTGNRKVK